MNAPARNTKSAAEVNAPAANAVVVAKADAVVAVAEQEMTIDEFCRRLSSRDRRVELIGAFHSGETRQGTVKATATEFQQRYEAFGNKPV